MFFFKGSSSLGSIYSGHSFLDPCVGRVPGGATGQLASHQGPCCSSWLFSLHQNKLLPNRPQNGCPHRTMYGTCGLIYIQFILSLSSLCCLQNLTEGNEYYSMVWNCPRIWTDSVSRQPKPKFMPPNFHVSLEFLGMRWVDLAAGLGAGGCPQVGDPGKT